MRQDVRAKKIPQNSCSSKINAKKNLFSKIEIIIKIIFQKLAPRSRMASMAEYSEEMELSDLRTPSRATTGPTSPVRISPVDHQRLADVLERHVQVDSGMASHLSAILLSSLQKESATIE